MKTLEKKYGLVLGRFQPFHLAHEALVHEVIADGLIPFVIIGSGNVLNNRNPYTLLQRNNMIRRVFPDIKIDCLDDNNNWDAWFKQLYSTIHENHGLDKSQIVWYINNKEKDRTYFEFDGKLYNNQFYTQIFQDLGYEVKEVTYPKLLSLDINATNIREDMDLYRHFLDARVYTYLKELESDREKISYFK